jgi:hypothetical protein
VSAEDFVKGKVAMIKGQDTPYHEHMASSAGKKLKEGSMEEKAFHTKAAELAAKHVGSGTAAFHTQQANLSAYKAAAKSARSKSETAEHYGDKFEGRDAHKAAGEAHLKAAAAAKTAGLQLVAHHETAATNHAEAAGGRWDDVKHPRDAQGRFT